MSYNSETTFNKENLDLYLKALGKEFRRLNGKATPADIILIGGAAVLANYGFRDMTADIDAIVRASSAMKDAIRSVGDRYNLPNGWLNSDFEHTASYTPKLLQYARSYRTFSNVLTVRTTSAESGPFSFTSSETGTRTGLDLSSNVRYAPSRNSSMASPESLSL